MSHRGVEIVLGRLATDESIRRRFREAPAEALVELTALGIELTAVERTALQSLEPDAIRRFAHALDPRLHKAVLVAPATHEAPSTQDDEAGE